MDKSSKTPLGKISFAEQEQLRRGFEQIIRSSKRWKDNTPLGGMTINGQFHHYMDPDTDTLWLGFLTGYRYRQYLVMLRRQLTTLIKNELVTKENKAVR